MKWLHDLLHRRCKDIPFYVPTKEQALALIGYCGESAIQSSAILKLSDQIEDLSLTEPLSGNVLDTYAAVSKLVTPVSGGSIIDSARVDCIVRPVTIWAIVIFVLVVVSGVIDATMSDVPDTSGGFQTWIYLIQRNGLDILSPFLWGALGSSVYLLKRYSDLAEAKLFSDERMQGWGTRLLLGAMLGGIIQFIYLSKSFTAGGLHLDANALGFLGGIGVKVVYGAIEKTISALGEAMNLDAVRKAPTQENAVRKFLGDTLAAESDPDKRKLLAELLELVNRPKTSE